MNFRLLAWCETRWITKVEQQGGLVACKTTLNTEVTNHWVHTHPVSSSPLDQHKGSPQSVQYMTMTCVCVSALCVCLCVCGSVRFPHGVGWLLFTMAKSQVLIHQWLSCYRKMCKSVSNTNSCDRGNSNPYFCHTAKCSDWLNMIYEEHIRALRHNWEKTHFKLKVAQVVLLEVNATFCKSITWRDTWWFSRSWWPSVFPFTSDHWGVTVSLRLDGDFSVGSPLFPVSLCVPVVA